MDNVRSAQPFLVPRFFSFSQRIPLLIKPNASLQAKHEPRRHSYQAQSLIPAAPGKKCELSTGQPRNEPHREPPINGSRVN
jgi:hypothetical protein